MICSGTKCTVPVLATAKCSVPPRTPRSVRVAVAASFAALALELMGRVPDVARGVELAGACIDDGHARRLLDGLAAFGRGETGPAERSR